MAWGEIKVEIERELFCLAILNGKLSIAEACRQFEISRQQHINGLIGIKMKG